MGAKPDDNDDNLSLYDEDGEEIGWQPTAARPLLARELAGLHAQDRPHRDDGSEEAAHLAGLIPAK